MLDLLDKETRLSDSLARTEGGVTQSKSLTRIITDNIYWHERNKSDDKFYFVFQQIVLPHTTTCKYEMRFLYL